LKSLAARSSAGVRIAIGVAAFIFKGNLRSTIQDYLINGLGSTVEKGK
jgi:hypothetical protein